MGFLACLCSMAIRMQEAMTVGSLPKLAWVGHGVASTNPFYLQRLPVKENYAHQRDSLKAPFIN